LFEAHHNDLEREVLKEIGIVLAWLTFFFSFLFDHFYETTSFIHKNNLKSHKSGKKMAHIIFNPVRKKRQIY
jgi:hypothetical protein